MRAPVAVALDTADLATAEAWAAAVAPYVSTVKIGLELYCRYGPDAARRIAAVAPDTALFLDLKLHDIPTTVAGAARALAALHPTYLTVHAAGGTAMIRAAADAVPEARVAAVTVLTSLRPADLDAVGLAGPAIAAARRLAVLAVSAGARALVCSPHEVAALRAEVGGEVTLITPGVRPADADADAGDGDGADGGAGPGADGGADDQARVATAEHALAAGADLLVVGRPITRAADPAAAAARLAAALLARSTAAQVPPAPATEPSR